MSDFREEVLDLAGQGVRIMKEYFEGKRAGTDKVGEASAMIREGVKVSNRDQVNEQVRRSQAIRLLPYIPKEKRDSYVAFTNPETKPFLLDSPGKNKK